MKTLNPTQNHICSCTNQHLLAYGETCEICMGVLDVNRELGLILPQPVYDAKYFEELEVYLQGPDGSGNMAA